MSSGRAIPADLVDFLEGGVSILVGTRDAGQRPETTRAVGAAVSPDRTRLSVLLAEHTAERAIANLEDNGRIAVAFSRPIDNFAVQLKGRVTELRRGDDADRRVAERYHAVYVEQLYMVGMPRSLSKRIRVWPSFAVTFEIDDIFVQTPGPGAGKPLEAT